MQIILFCNPFKTYLDMVLHNQLYVALLEQVC